MSAQSTQSIRYCPVPNFPAYRVGSDGSVWSKWAKGPGATPNRESWKKMKANPDHEGYRRLTLVAPDGTKHSFKVCALMLLSFVGPRPEGQEARHLDGDNGNDAADNLCWGTPLENHADKRRHGTIATGENHGNAKLTDAQIAELRGLKGQMIQQEAADRFGVSRGYVGQLWAGARKRGQ